MKQIRLFVPLLVVVAALFLLVGSASANPSVTVICGEGGYSDGVLGISKKVKCEAERTWDWDITKVVDQPELTLSIGQSHMVNYTVTASAMANGAFYIAGPITVRNVSAAPVTVVAVEDTLTADVTCDVALPVTLAPGDRLGCDFAGSFDYQPPTNTLKVTRADGTVTSVSVPIDWSLAPGTDTGECADINDTFAGDLGTVCAGASTTFTFTYSRQIGPYDVCGDYRVDNTASFYVTETGEAGSDDAAVLVDVPCAGGCTLTPGYWKTHSLFGPAPYDMTWALVGGAGAEFFDTGLSYYQVLWTSPTGGNAYFILAHAYIAAKLNFLNEASVPGTVQTAFDQATALLIQYQYDLAFGKKDPNRAVAITLAGILDNYNNGLIGPGHCSE